MDTKFLDEAIGQLARGGPQGTWQVGLDGSGPRLVAYESANTWAKRVAEQALALATARERLLLDVQTGGATVVGIPEDCPKCESERRKADGLDSALQGLHKDLAAERRNAAKLVDMLSAAKRERDEARAEVERLNARWGTYGDIVRPDWIDAPFTAAEHIPVLTAGAAEHLRSYAVSMERVVRAQNEEVEKWRGAASALCGAHIGQKFAACPACDASRLRSSPPTVCTVDVEKAAAELFDVRFGGYANAVAVLRRHTRAASPEALARAIYGVDGWKPTPSEVRETIAERIAAEALSHLGVALAEKPAAPAPGGWLIEVPGPLYWTGRDGCGAWADHNDAIRFARWEDADRLRRTMGFDTATCREHAWIPRATEAQREPEIVRPVPAVECAPAPGGFVLDRAKVLDAYLEAKAGYFRMTDGIFGTGPHGHEVGIDAAIAEYERQRAEHAKGWHSLDVRPAVARFALDMERKLRANDHKGGWQHDGFGALVRRLREEVDELAQCETAAVIDEAADVANFAMMIADNARKGGAA